MPRSITNVTKTQSAREVARFRVHNLLALYPDQFPVYTCKTSNLPQDIIQTIHGHLGAECTLNLDQQLVVAVGWAQPIKLV
jgi:hypothetical protein